MNSRSRRAQVGFLCFFLNKEFKKFLKLFLRNFLFVNPICNPFYLFSIFSHVDHSIQYDLFSIFTVDCGDSIGSAIPDSAFYGDIKQSIVLSPFLYSI